MSKSIVLLSGGLDSTTVLYYALNKGHDCYCLIFDYGQRHKKEVGNAIKIARLTGCKYRVIKFRLPWSVSSLTGTNIKIPVHDEIRNDKIPSTYVPARNTIFLSFALSWADSIGADKIFIGANAVDFSGYPDCRPVYYEQVQKVAKYGTKSGLKKQIRIMTPLINFTKEGIVRLGIRLKVPFNLTWSCYNGGNKPCGTCDSCKFRQKGFSGARMIDPALRP
jgi:7-cyano-7-deazaguanine synthase